MIRVNKHLENVNRVRSKYSPIDQLRLHASERDLAFDARLWDAFVGALRPQDVRLYPNIDKAYDLLSELVSIDKEFLTVAEGSDRILKSIFECFAISGLKVVTTNPAFPMYKVYAKMQGANFLAVDYREERFPLKDFLKAIDQSTSLVVLSNPSSPVGDGLSREQLKLIAEKCKENNCLLVVDEAYIEFSNLPSAIDMIIDYNLVVVRTLSKAYGSAGVRIGYAVSNFRIKQYLEKVSSMNELSGLAIKWLEALVLYDDSNHYISLVKENRKYLFDELIRSNMKFIDSQSNYVNIQGNLKLERVLTKVAIMPWDNQEYTRISIPADHVNFVSLLAEISKL